MGTTVTIERLEGENCLPSPSLPSPAQAPLSPSPDTDTVQGLLRRTYAAAKAIAAEKSDLKVLEQFYRDMTVKKTDAAKQALEKHIQQYDADNLALLKYLPCPPRWSFAWLRARKNGTPLKTGPVLVHIDDVSCDVQPDFDGRSKIPVNDPFYFRCSVSYSYQTVQFTGRVHSYKSTYHEYYNFKLIASHTCAAPALCKFTMGCGMDQVQTERILVTNAFERIDEANMNDDTLRRRIQKARSYLLSKALDGAET